jgi:hypothetical protein
MISNRATASQRRSHRALVPALLSLGLFAAAIAPGCVAGAGDEETGVAQQADDEGEVRQAIRDCEHAFPGGSDPARKGCLQNVAQWCVNHLGEARCKDIFNDMNEGWPL